jgi:hypothetical protein
MVAVQEVASDAPLRPGHLPRGHRDAGAPARFKVDLPMCGIVGRDSGGVMILREPCGQTGRVRWTPETGPENKVELNPYLLGGVYGQKV